MLEDGHIMCNTGAVARRAAYFGSSSYGPVSIGSIQCSGSETRLQDCGLSQTPGSACTHSQDAGVMCVGKRDIVACYSKCKLTSDISVIINFASLCKW